MVFSSIVFLCFFLPSVLVLYLLCPIKFRNLLLLLVSLLFYAWGEPKYILIMLFSTVFDYCNGRALEYFQEHQQPGKRKGILILSIVGNLGILCFFKYTDFILNNLHHLGVSVSLLNLALPIGISFYTFQTMSYTIDVYRGNVKPQHNFIAFAMYVSMFPQLIAGPIVRYQAVEQDLCSRELVSRDMAQGMQRFLVGLAKKVILANQIGALWTEISSGSNLTAAGAWLGALAYTFQIYFDFSGYSDMAIGLGQIFGFHFPENFNYPYESKSITEFWRRWHMTLSTWFREYLYIPLGGSRHGRRRQIINLLIVWALTGLWHGAAWNFVIWGLYFFVLLMIEKLYLLRYIQSLQDWVRHFYAFFFIVFGWVLFANEGFGELGHYIAAMFGFGGGWCDQTAMYQWYTHLPLLFLLCFASTHLPKRILSLLWNRMKSHISFCDKYHQEIKMLAAGGYTMLLLIGSLAFLVNGSYNPFLYFRF